MFATPLGGRLAQSVEHLTFNQRVTGSNPVAPTIPRLGFSTVRMFFTLFWGAYGEQIKPS
jgi:hypothetical protein